MRLEVAPAGVRRCAEARAVRQPLQAVEAGLVLFFGRADLDLDLDLVMLVSTHDRGERVTSLAVAVDAITCAGAIPWRWIRRVAKGRIELWQLAIATALERQSEIARHAIGLGTALPVRSDLVRVEDT